MCKDTSGTQSQISDLELSYVQHMKILWNTSVREKTRLWVVNKLHQNSFTKFDDYFTRFDYNKTDKTNI